MTHWLISNTLGYIWFCLIPLKRTPTGRQIAHGMEDSARTDDTCCLIQAQTSARDAFVSVSSLVSWWFAGKAKWTPEVCKFRHTCRLELQTGLKPSDRLLWFKRVPTSMSLTFGPGGPGCPGFPCGPAGPCEKKISNWDWQNCAKV